MSTARNSNSRSFCTLALLSSICALSACGPDASDSPNDAREPKGLGGAEGSGGSATGGMAGAPTVDDETKAAVLDDWTESQMRGVAASSDLAARADFDSPVFSIEEGELPEGVSLSSEGLLEGTPKSAGTFVVDLKVTEADDTVSLVTLRLEIREQRWLFSWEYISTTEPGEPVPAFIAVDLHAENLSTVTLFEAFGGGSFVNGVSISPNGKWMTAGYQFVYGGTSWTQLFDLASPDLSWTTVDSGLIMDGRVAWVPGSDDFIYPVQTSGPDFMKRYSDGEGTTVGATAGSATPVFTLLDENHLAFAASDVMQLEDISDTMQDPHYVTFDPAFEGSPYGNMFEFIETSTEGEVIVDRGYNPTDYFVLDSSGSTTWLTNSDGQRVWFAGDGQHWIESESDPAVTRLVARDKSIVDQTNWNTNDFAATADGRWLVLEQAQSTGSQRRVISYDMSQDSPEAQVLLPTSDHLATSYALLGFLPGEEGFAVRAWSTDQIHLVKLDGGEASPVETVNLCEADCTIEDVALDPGGRFLLVAYHSEEGDYIDRISIAAKTFGQRTNLGQVEPFEKFLRVAQDGRTAVFDQTDGVTVVARVNDGAFATRPLCEAPCNSQNELYQNPMLP